MGRSKVQRVLTLLLLGCFCLLDSVVPVCGHSVCRKCKSVDVSLLDKFEIELNIYSL